MANKRIKDLATTATSPAGDDYIAIDGVANNTRRILADSFLQDAPTDGDLYGRKDGAWEEAASPDDVPLVPTFVYDGTAETTEFVVGNIPNDWQSNNADLTQLSIGNSATSIGSSAFYYCSGFTGDLTIPNSVTSIGSSAFRFNPLTSVTIPNSVTLIGSYAFANNSLTSVTIASGVTSLGNYAFANNASLVSVTLNEGLLTINQGAFNSCGLTSITIPSSVTTIGGYSFESNFSLTSVVLASGRTTIPNSFAAYAFIFGAVAALTIPSGVTSIGSNAFNGCTGFTGDLIIPNSVTSIGSYAFNGCTGFTGDLIIPNSVTTIGNNAFSRNSLTSVTIGNSVTTIGSGAFSYSSPLATVNCYAPATAFTGSNAFYTTASPLTINVPTSGAVADTWTAGTGLTFQGNTNVTVAKNL